MRLIVLVLSLIASLPLAAQIAGPAKDAGGGMALSPARFELEMKPGTETTVVVNLDYKAAVDQTQPARIVATLNDWNITKDGRVEFFRPASQPSSAASWMIYSPGEASVMPNTIHQIRVTISVPLDAQPGDHLAALIVEQRPDSLKFAANSRQMIVRYRMASVFYIKVPGLTRHGELENLLAESGKDGVVVTPVIKNSGNSMIRPVSSLKVLDADGKTVADVPDIEPLPVLAGAESKPSVLVARSLPPGNYTVKYKVDFNDGSKATEGVTDLVVKAPQIATVAPTRKNP